MPARLCIRIQTFGSEMERGKETFSRPQVYLRPTGLKKFDGFPKQINAITQCWTLDERTNVPGYGIYIVLEQRHLSVYKIFISWTVYI